MNRVWYRKQSSRFPDEYGGEITSDNTKLRPFKMVKTGGKKTVSESETQIQYWARMLDECGA